MWSGTGHSKGKSPAKMAAGFPAMLSFLSSPRVAAGSAWRHVNIGILVFPVAER